MMLISSFGLLAQDIQEPTLQEFIIHEETETITINNKNFELFLSGIVQEAVQEEKQLMLSEALLRCYQSMMEDQKECFIKDLQEALPELLMIASAYCHDKAPRPGIASSIENEIVGPGACDLSAILQLLNQIFTALNRCCAILQQDFRETWTILNAGFNGTFTAIQDINADTSGTFSLLADINNSLTICCGNITREFQETWTILGAGFNGTFSVIAEINTDAAGTFSVLADINNSLTICCENITREFQETWTILDAGFNGTFTVLNTISSPCAATPITAPTIISEPGYYCLANDIVGTVTITATNATFDLNNHTISAPGTSAIILNGAVNVIVDNGKIDNAAIGVDINLSTTNIISNLVITDCSSRAIEFDTSSDSNIVEDIIIDSCPSVGILAFGIANSQFTNILIRNTNTPVLMSGPSNIFENIQIIDCTGSSAFLALSAINNKFINCSIINFEGFRGFDMNARGSILENCSVQNIFTLNGVNNVIGIAARGDTMTIKNSSVVDVQSIIGSIGFQVDQPNTTLENCFVQTCSSTSAFSDNSCFSAGNTITACNFINCKAYASAGYGFNIANGTSTNLVIQDCESAYNSLDGFLINNINAC